MARGWLLLLLSPLLLAAAPARFVRTGEVERNAAVQIRPSERWRAAVRNMPLLQGTRMRTEDGLLEAEFDDGSTLRLTGNALAEVSDYCALSTGRQITLLSIDHGTVYFTGRPRRGETLAIALPGAQITLRNRARVRFEVTADVTEIAILEGTVNFSTSTAELDLPEGRTARVQARNTSRFELLREVVSLETDDWSRKRDALQEASLSTPHLPGVRFGAADLDSAGSWLQTEHSGLVWKPKVAEDWVPFRSGFWVWYQEVGYTWIAAEKWGWTPYHYGRWLQHASLGWVWAPGSRTVFKPGEVYWLRSNGLSLWGPLAPQESWTGEGAPSQFAAVNTSVARFEPGQLEIQLSPLVARPKDLLSVAQFTAALPSPSFPAAHLDAKNAPLRAVPVSMLNLTSAPAVHVPAAASERRPAHQAASALIPQAAVPPAPRPPTPIMTERPVYVEVPQPIEIFYPVPVYTGVLVINPVMSDGRKKATEGAVSESEDKSSRDRKRRTAPEATAP